MWVLGGKSIGYISPGFGKFRKWKERKKRKGKTSLSGQFLVCCDWYATSDIKTVIICYSTVTDWYATSDIKTVIMCYGTVTDFPLFYIMRPHVYDPPHNI